MGLQVPGGLAEELAVRVSADGSLQRVPVSAGLLLGRQGLLRARLGAIAAWPGAGAALDAPFPGSAASYTVGEGLGGVVAGQFIPQVM